MQNIHTNLAAPATNNDIHIFVVNIPADRDLLVYHYGGRVVF